MIAAADRMNCVDDEGDGVQSTGVQVGTYLVVGNEEHARIVEKRIGKEYILEEFKGKKKEGTAFERAVAYARTL